ncbi:YpmS family protein [Anaerobacillus sp. CMMVII]|uniref:YpmS family protein n=1 Tax=Anaerobacillus sp. CMMVII TaxID=2755588 RepID=UPI0021B75163|nr:YpmS family protein [Anaerobacillus sp. CMMVII]MCT8139496.1 YpmS family protein [Anaerobacillus sp. CMMVII]
MKMKRNIWKIAFFSLLSSLAFLFIFIMIVLYFFVASPDYAERERHQSMGDTMFVISTTKGQLNQFIAEQISRDGNQNFQIILKDYIVLEATIPLFGRRITMQIDLEPQLYGDGDLLLKSSSFRLGEFQLPSDVLFSLIKNTLSFPEWIELNAAEETILLNITEIDALESMSIKVVQFDLVRDIIEFELVSLNK